MSTEIVKYKAPTLAELISDKEMAFAQDDLNLILNTPVPENWIMKHPYVNIKIKGQSVPLPYIPVKRVKYLLKRIYGKYEWEVKECKQVLNAMVVVGKLTIINPVTGQKESQDGIGAAAIQMDKGATQGDLSAIKANAIQIGAPAAESYALKNAAEKFGDIFGGNIYDVDSTSYSRVFGNDVRSIDETNDSKEIVRITDFIATATTPDMLITVYDSVQHYGLVKIYEAKMAAVKDAKRDAEIKIIRQEEVNNE